MIEPVGHHQARYRLPGLVADARGIALGERALLLFASLDRLLNFLRAYSEVESLDELIPSLELHQVVTPLRSTEFTMTLLGESSYRMDRVAELCRVTRGHCYTGTGRYFIRYRDSQGPFGYDVASTVETSSRASADGESELVVHDLAFSQGYRIQRPLSLRALLFRLRPRPVPRTRQRRPDSYWLTTEAGLFQPMVRYLTQAGAVARGGTFEGPQGSSFRETPLLRTLIELDPPPERVIQLLRDLPGVHLFARVSERVAVEVGFQHPVALESCGSAFEDGSLTLFHGDGTVGTVPVVPTLVPLRSLISAPASGAQRIDDWASPDGESATERFRIKLRIVRTVTEARRADATVVSTSDWSVLARTLHMLPPAIIQSLELAITDAFIFIKCDKGLEGIPLGEYFRAVGRGLFVPRGSKITPEISKEVLPEVIPALAHSMVFLRSDDAEPWVVANEAFGPVSRWAVMRSPAQLLGEPLSGQDRPLGASFGYGDRPFIPGRVKSPKPAKKQEE